MLRRQRGKCALCRKQVETATRRRNFSVDHCHETGRIRGILCQRCNQILALANDDVRFLRRCIDYLSA